MDKLVRLNIGGMTCVNCQNKIEKKLNHTKGIVSATVSYNSATADIVYNEEKISLKEIVATVKSLGYKVIPGKKVAGPNIKYVV